MKPLRPLGLISIIVGLGTLAVLLAVVERSGIPGTPGVRTTAAPPNVVLITVDTLRPDRLGAYGSQRALTPAIDALAARGTVFESAFTVAPVTLPAHATLLTGRLPARHGIRGNSFYALPETEIPLAQVLRQQGYRTGAFVGAAVLDGRFGLNRGFDRYDDSVPAGAPAGLIAERRAGTVVASAIEWLADPRPQPFFLWVHLFDPHHPYEAPEPLGSQFAGAPYDAEVAYVDQEIGRLLRALTSRDLTRGTVIVLTSDHGESLGEHGEQTHGVFLYDATLRVPLIMAGPGLPEGKRVRGDPVSLADVMPTLLGLIDVQAPPELDGHDLFTTPLPRREFVYAETYLPRDFYNWSELHALRSSRMKFIDGPVPELYDLQIDPEELENQASGDPRAVEHLTRTCQMLAAGSERTIRMVPDADLAGRLRSLGYVAGAAPDSPGRAPSPNRPDPKDLLHLVRRLDEALAYRRAGQLETAVRLLRDIQQEDPGNYLAAHTLADALFDLGRDADAVAAYRMAMRGRQFAYYHYRLGLLLERQRDYAAAAREFGSLARLSEDSVEEILARAESLLDRGALAAAQAYLEELAEAGVRGADFDLRLADLRARTGQLDRAADGLRQAVERDPANDALRKAHAQVLTALGVSRGEAGDLDGAVAAFRRALALAPTNADAMANLALTHLRQGNSDAALDTLGRALALRPDETRLINIAAELRFRRNELEAARLLLARSLAADPEQPRISEALREVERRLAQR